MSSDRLRALDGLRALSVLGVFVSGWHYVAPVGWIGVLVFYVLSGFLITRILLDEREHARPPEGMADAGGFFGRFYFRRTLRIFPLYFAYLLLIELSYAALSVPEAWSQVRPFAWLYGVNVGMVVGAVGTADAYGHLWTLSVEEQFYLVWPIVVWLCARTTLARIALILFLAGPLVRWASVSLFSLSIGQLYVSSFSHLDAFAAGALLATLDLARVRHARNAAVVAVLVTLGIGFVIQRQTGAALATLGYPEGLRFAYAYYWGYSLLDACAALVILAALRGELPLLGHPVLAYIGKISYAVYLFQRPIKGIYFAQIESKVTHALPTVVAHAVGAALCMSVAIGLAALSYRLLEAPILRYRDRVRPPLRSPVRGC